MPALNLDVGSGAHAVQDGRDAALAWSGSLARAASPDGVLVYGDTDSTLAGALARSKRAYRRWPATMASPRGGGPALLQPARCPRSATGSWPIAWPISARADPAAIGQPRPRRTRRARGAGRRRDGRRAGGPARRPQPPARRRRRRGRALPAADPPPGRERRRPPSGWARFFGMLAVDRPVICPVHPRTREAIDASRTSAARQRGRVDPVGYLAMVALEGAAAAIATDSGGVQKEAYLAGVPCITLRSETEWVETVAAGWNRVGLEAGSLRAALDDARFMRPRSRSAARPVRRRAWRPSRIVTALEGLQRRREGAFPPRRSRRFRAQMIPIARPQMGDEEKELVWSAMSFRCAGPGEARGRVRGRIRRLHRRPARDRREQSGPRRSSSRSGPRRRPRRRGHHRALQLHRDGHEHHRLRREAVFADIDPLGPQPRPGEDRAPSPPRRRPSCPSTSTATRRGPELADICERDGLALVEDAAQAHGAEHQGRRPAASAPAASASTRRRT